MNAEEERKKFVFNNKGSVLFLVYHIPHLFGFTLDMSKENINHNSFSLQFTSVYALVSQALNQGQEPDNWTSHWFKEANEMLYEPHNYP